MRELLFNVVAMRHNLNADFSRVKLKRAEVPCIMTKILRPLKSVWVIFVFAIKTLVFYEFS